MTHNLVGYKLVEVRTGYGLKPIYRTGITPSGTLDAVCEKAHHVFIIIFLQKLIIRSGSLWTHHVLELAFSEEDASQQSLEKFLDFAQ